MMIFRLHRDFTFKSIHRGHFFDSEWLRLEENGMLTVGAGYAWNGCSPRVDILGIATFGTPNGNMDTRIGKPLTYYASLVHDVCYRYLDELPITRKEVDVQFYEMMKANEFPLATLYYWSVRLFGGFSLRRN